MSRDQKDRDNRNREDKTKHETKIELYLVVVYEI
jgi:hypothetical protein